MWRQNNKQPSGERPSDILVDVRQVVKTYESAAGRFVALAGLDLQAPRGRFMAIIGKSGSGKSTLMHLLACLDSPTSGSVLVDDEDVSLLSERSKNTMRNEKFGFVFQQFFLNGRDTVFENVVLPMKIRGRSSTEIEAAAKEAISAVGLIDKSSKRAKDLSGGEKQRVCIARALIGGPQVIFADEPTGNLDSNTGAAVEEMLFGLNREKKITLVVVTHDDELARRCNRVIEMKDGMIISQHVREAVA